MVMLNKKKEDNLELPNLPPPRTPISQEDFSDHDTVDDEISSLPSFPNSPNHNMFSQAAIKAAVSTEEKEENIFEEHHEEERNIGTVEMEEWTPSVSSGHAETPTRILPTLEHLPDRRGSLGMPHFKERIMEIPNNATTSNDVFVKIDKFHSAKKTLVEIQEKLENIDDMIKKIRETKIREEQELSSWESDLTNIKSRIKDVSENIFEKA